MFGSEVDVRVLIRMNITRNRNRIEIEVEIQSRAMGVTCDAEPDTKNGTFVADTSDDYVCVNDSDSR